MTQTSPAGTEALAAIYAQHGRLAATYAAWRGRLFALVFVGVIAVGAIAAYLSGTSLDRLPIAGLLGLGALLCFAAAPLERHIAMALSITYARLADLEGDLGDDALSAHDWLAGRAGAGRRWADQPFGSPAFGLPLLYAALGLALLILAIKTGLPHFEDQGGGVLQGIGG